ncbi:MAG: alpha/beta fold hydrolase [Devosia sp.]
MATKLHFVHGGGDDALAYDKKIASRLQAQLGDAFEIEIPLIPGLEALDWPATARELGKVLGALPPSALVVAHSIGAAAVLKLLSEGTDASLKHLFLLAPPYQGKDGDWGDSDFGFVADFDAHLPKGLPITLFHSDDDDTIPVDSAHHYASVMPGAKVVIVHDYGHQFSGSLAFLAKAIKAAA